MKTLFNFRKILPVIIFLLFAFSIQAQEKEIAKVDSYIAKAVAATDPVKKTEYYNKAAEIIRTAKLGKEQFIKIAEAYLEEGDITNAVKYYGFCDKEDKKAGYVKVGYKMLETAFDEPKTEAKTVRKAVDYFTKGDAAAEGYEAAGDAYYNRGKEFYMTAADYYAQGKVASKIQQVADEFFAEGNAGRAAEVYMKLNTEYGYTKAGDIYFEAGDYNNAFTAYDKGGIGDGIKKYADMLYEQGDIANADAMYNKAADLYAAKTNSSALAALAEKAEERGNYAMATVFYEKAGEPNKAAKARANDKLISLDFEGAIAEFTALGDDEMVKAINGSMKYLTPLKEVANYFDDVKNNQPFVSYTEDSVTKQRTPNPDEYAIFVSYYKESASDIADNCYIVSTNVTKITHTALKEAMMKKFKKFGAIRNILDSNFGKKLQKAQVTAKDAIL